MENEQKSAGSAGRPTTYSDEIANEICERISDGEWLKGICEDDHMPARNTVYLWLNDEQHSDFAGNYDRAREHQGDGLAEQMMSLNTKLVAAVLDDDGKLKDKGIDRDTVQAIKAASDNFRWMASRLKPAAYGERLGVEVAGTLKHEHKMIAPNLERAILKAQEMRERLAAQGGPPTVEGTLAGPVSEIEAEPNTAE